MVMGDNSCSKGRGFKSWMDIFHIDLCKNCVNVCLKRLKINIEEAGFGPFF